MRRFVVGLILLVLVLWYGFPRSIYAYDDKKWTSIAKQYESTIVEIDVSVTYGDGNRASWWASGFFIAPDLVFTNAHVALDEDELTLMPGDIEGWIKTLRSREYRFRVGFNGKHVNAVAYATNPLNDTAILKLDHPIAGVTPAVFGDSDTVRVGEEVIAIGRPLGYSYSVTRGIVSAVHRRDSVNLCVIEDYIQTDAAVNPGNSGGVLLNLKGEVIGIVNSSDRRGQGLHFAISSNLAKRFLPRMLNGEHIRAGISGVDLFLGRFNDSLDNINALVELSQRTGIEDVTILRAIQELLVRSNSFGALVVGLDQRSLASSILKRGDVVTEFGGRRVNNGFEFREMLLEAKADEGYPITVIRFVQSAQGIQMATIKETLRIESRGSYFLRLLRR